MSTIIQTDPRSIDRPSVHERTRYDLYIRSNLLRSPVHCSRRKNCPQKHSMTPLYMHHSQNPVDTKHWCVKCESLASISIVRMFSTMSQRHPGAARRISKISLVTMVARVSALVRRAHRKQQSTWNGARSLCTDFVTRRRIPIRDLYINSRYPRTIRTAP